MRPRRGRCHARPSPPSNSSGTRQRASRRSGRTRAARPRPSSRSGRPMSTRRSAESRARAGLSWGRWSGAARHGSATPRCGSRWGTMRLARGSHPRPTPSRYWRSPTRPRPRSPIPSTSRRWWSSCCPTQSASVCDLPLLLTRARTRTHPCTHTQGHRPPLAPSPLPLPPPSPMALPCDSRGAIASPFAHATPLTCACALAQAWCGRRSPPVASRSTCGAPCHRPPSSSRSAAWQPPATSRRRPTRCAACRAGG